MKTLNFNREEDETTFDQLMDTNGEWSETMIRLKNSVQKLKYISDNWDYYIFESDCGVHILLRNRR